MVFEKSDEKNDGNIHSWLGHMSLTKMCNLGIFLSKEEKGHVKNCGLYAAIKLKRIFF